MTQFTNTQRPPIAPMGPFSFVLINAYPHAPLVQLSQPVPLAPPRRSSLDGVEERRRQREQATTATAPRRSALDGIDERRAMRNDPCASLDERPIPRQRIDHHDLLLDKSQFAMITRAYMQHAQEEIAKVTIDGQFVADYDVRVESILDTMKAEIMAMAMQSRPREVEPDMTVQNVIRCLELLQPHHQNEHLTHVRKYTGDYHFGGDVVEGCGRERGTRHVSGAEFITHKWCVPAERAKIIKAFEDDHIEVLLRVELEMLTEQFITEVVGQL